jgi:hypothetical protein
VNQCQKDPILAEMSQAKIHYVNKFCTLPQGFGLFGIHSQEAHEKVTFKFSGHRGGGIDYCGESYYSFILGSYAKFQNPRSPILEERKKAVNSSY